jgi:hypothetical protein
MLYIILNKGYVNVSLFYALLRKVFKYNE